MKVSQAIDSMFEVFGVPDNSAAPEIMRRRIFNDLNSAMQILWTKGHRLLDFYTRSEVTITILANQKSISLSNSIQSVLGPIRRPDGVLLRPISTRGEYENYHAIYSGSLAPSAPSSPEAYFLESGRNSGEDASLLTLHIVPSPSINTELKIGVSLNAPSFTLADYNTPTDIPIPHNYAETLLLPIARYLVCSSLFFADKSKQREPLLKSEYDRAMQSLTEAV